MQQLLHDKCLGIKSNISLQGGLKRTRTVGMFVIILMCQHLLFNISNGTIKVKRQHVRDVDATHKTSKGKPNVSSNPV